MSDCVFCDIIAGEAPADDYVLCGAQTVAFTPLNPVTEGHTLVVPRLHVENAASVPEVTGETMKWASIMAGAFESANLITSIGEPATQSVTHLHIHLVPRRPGDGLTLPWTGQQRGDSDA